MICNTKKLAQSSFSNFSVFQLIFLLSQKAAAKATTIANFYWDIKILLHWDPGTLKKAQGPQVLCDIGKVNNGLG